MSNFKYFNIFANYQQYLEKDQELREKIRNLVRNIEQYAKEAVIKLQIIHCDLTQIEKACQDARAVVAICADKYKDLIELVPKNNYYRYSDHWTFITQRMVFIIALIVYLEKGELVTREAVAELLGLKTLHSEGFHLDMEDYFVGSLQLASELARFAINAVTLGDFTRPVHISRFVAELNAGFRLLNLKNDGLRKRYDGLKYDVKKIEDVVYDISIRGLNPTNPVQVRDNQTALAATTTTNE